MADIAINPVVRRVQFTGNTGLGPFAFTFNILQNTDIIVYKNTTLLTLTTDYTVTINANGTGSVTLTGSGSGTDLILTDNLTIIGGRELSRTTDFVTAGDLLASSLNEQLDSNVIMSQQLDERFSRTISVSPGDADKTLTLPTVADRKDKILKFDTEGNVEAAAASTIFANTIIGANFTNNVFTGDGSTVAFTTTVAAGSKNNCQIYIDGVYQEKASFSINATTLTFTEAPPLNASIEVIIGNAIETLDADSGNINYNQGGTGAQTRTVENKLQEFVSVKDFGATGDGVTDDTAALIRAANSMTDGSAIHFPSGTYLVSRQGFSSFDAVYGNYVFDIDDVDNIRITGDGATIKIVNHDISTYGGLGMFKLSNCNGATISGLNFDMTFTGFKSSSSFYPQCGAIIFTNDSSADGQDPNDLSGDILIEHCEFKLFHPLGSYGVNADPANYYAGDPNNGFKIFTVFVTSPFSADQYENTGRNCTIRDCRIKEGHNAYGFWVWATYNAVFDNLVAESFVTKRTEVDTSTILGGSVPFIRHHQFRTEGAKVTNCYFRARPSSERTEAGFEGSGNFINFVTNIDEDLAKGEYIVANNIITHGGGDPVYSADTNIIQVSAYGNFIYDGNIFDGHDGETNGGYCILHTVGNGSTGGGVGSIVISNNIWGKWSKTNNIQISTGNNTAAYNRRYQQVSITGNLSLSQDQYFLFLGNNTSYTYDGVQALNVSNNIIDGTYSAWDKTSTNSAAINLKGGTETTDNYVVGHNQIRSKYYGIIDNTTNANVNTFGNKFTDVTDHFSQAAVTEIISGHEQGAYTAEFQGSSGCNVIAKEVSANKSIQIYTQTSNQYLMATDRINFYTDGDNQVILDDGVFRPDVDGDITLGTGTFKFGQIYSTVGSISTSDERKKQDIANLEQAELNVATSLKGLIKKFKYKSAVADKGDDARTHIGVIAQEVKAAFEAEGLDPFEYGILCLDTWDDQYTYNIDNEQVLTREAGEEYAIRYDELFAFIIAAL